MQVTVGSATVTLTARREQVLLAMLLLHVGEAVQIERLIDAVWDEHLPRNALGQIHGGVYRLRKRLRALGRKDLVITEPGGYRIQADPRTVDMWEFRRMRAEARAATVRGDHNTAAREYRAALLLWRGAALTGVNSVEVKWAAAALDEERVQAQQECIEVELALGKAGELVAELTELVQRHPYRERLHALLMHALYAAGRQADALTVYRQARQLLLDELGAEPGPELQRLHHAILSGETNLAPSSSAGPITLSPLARPRELPAPPPMFTGRSPELAMLDHVQNSSTVVITAIDGMAGVGKTALAVQCAHRLAERYPDGQIFLDLHGFTDTLAPIEPADALDRLLRTLGVPGERIPVEMDGRAGMWRSAIAGRRMLVVLDNAATESQVAPLLPGTEGCLVLVTSRRRLAGLEATHSISLDMLPLSDALRLFTLIAGKGRLADEPGDRIVEIVELCGRLPLAIRIAAARIRSHPSWTTADLVERLRDLNQRLAELEAGQATVTAALDLSYQQLTTYQQRMYRLLGLHPGPNLSVFAAAALADSTHAQAVQLLDQLFHAHLLQEPTPRRFVFHDLVRAHAVAAAMRDEAEPEVALGRLLDHYGHIASMAVGTAYPRERRRHTRVPPTGAPVPDLSDTDSAVAWLDNELANLLATARHAADNGCPDHTWHLSATLHQHLRIRGRYTDAEALHRQAFTTARISGDRASELSALADLGQILVLRSRFEHAIDHYQEALEIAKTTGDRDGELTVLKGLGNAYRLQERHDQATHHYRRALELAQATGHDDGRIDALTGLGWIDLFQGRHLQALEHHQLALAIARETGDHAGQLNALTGLGWAHGLQEMHDHATDHFRQALEIAHASGDRAGEEDALTGLGWIDLQQGRLTQAVSHYEQALEIAHATGHHAGELIALNGLGNAYRREGRYDQATDQYQRALVLAHGFGDRNSQYEALHGLGRLHQLAGRLEAALAHHHQALELATDLRQPTDQARAYDGLAYAYRAMGQPEQARRHWRRALHILTSLGIDHTADEQASATTIRAQLANLDLEL